MNNEIVKFAIKDYFTSFSLGASRRSLKEKGNIRSSLVIWFWIIYAMCNSILSNEGSFNFFSMKLWLIIACVLPMLFSFASIMAFPAKLEKRMYICPMSKAERRIYIRATYIFRIIVQMTFAIIAVAFIFFNSNCDIISAAVMIFNNLVLSILVYPGAEDSSDAKHIMESVHWIALLIIALLINIIEFAAIVDNGPTMLFHIIMLLVIGIIELPPLFTYIKYIKSELKDAETYV